MGSFLEAIRKALGHAPDHIESGRLVRFSTSGRRGDLSGWARLFDDGEGGAFGCWRSGISENWQVRTPHTEEERQKWAEAVRRNRERAERELADLRAECRQKSAKLWERARDVDAGHPYIVAKGIRPFGSKQLRDSLLIPVRGADGELRGIQFIGRDGGKKFKTGTEISGGYHSIGRPKNKTLLVCEGWATGCSLHEATGYAVAVAFNAGNLLPVCEELRAKYPFWRLIVCADDDQATPSNPGITKGAAAARVVGALLAVPDFAGVERGTGDTDFNDLLAKRGLDAVRQAIETAALPDPAPADKKPAGAKSGGEAIPADPPLLFDDNHTPEISPTLLPSWLGEFAEAVARSTQTPPAMAVMLALSAVATCTAKRFEVAPHGEGYSEPLNLWTATALPPASRKTAVITAITAPLIEWEMSESERLASEIKRVAAKRRALEKRREKLAKDAANADDQDRLNDILAKMECLEYEIPDELHAPRLWTSDTTPERLQSLLVDHGERMAVLTDEGGIFEIMSGLYNDGRANLDIFLQGHAGRAVRVDRQGRTAHLDAPALTFGLAVQPDVLMDLGSGGKRRFRGNGTLARFLFAIPRSNIGRRDPRATYQVPPKIEANYRAGLFALLTIPPQMINGREVTRRLILSPDALDSWLAFAEMVERRQGEDGDLEAIQDWSGKLPGAALRIAGNFHLIEHGAAPPAEIEAATIERALDLCVLLIEHAKAALSMVGAETANSDAKVILKWIVAENLIRFRKGAAYRHFKGRFTGQGDRFDKALKELEDRAIITAIKEATPGRAATVFIVNPRLWEKSS